MNTKSKGQKRNKEANQLSCQKNTLLKKDANVRKTKPLIEQLKINEVDNDERVKRTPIYKILAVYHFEKYAKAFVQKGYGSNLQKFNSMSPKQIDDLLETHIKVLSKDKTQMKDLIQYVNDLFPTIADVDELRVSQSTKDFLSLLNKQNIIDFSSNQAKTTNHKQANVHHKSMQQMQTHLPSVSPKNNQKCNSSFGSKTAHKKMKRPVSQYTLPSQHQVGQTLQVGYNGSISSSSQNTLNKQMNSVQRLSEPKRQNFVNRPASAKVQISTHQSTSQLQSNKQLLPPSKEVQALYELLPNATTKMQSKQKPAVSPQKNKQTSSISNQIKIKKIGLDFFDALELDEDGSFDNDYGNLTQQLDAILNSKQQNQHSFQPSQKAKSQKCIINPPNSSVQKPPSFKQCGTPTRDSSSQFISSSSEKKNIQDNNYSKAEAETSYDPHSDSYQGLKEFSLRQDKDVKNVLNQQYKNASKPIIQKDSYLYAKSNKQATNQQQNNQAQNAKIAHLNSLMLCSLLKELNQESANKNDPIQSMFSQGVDLKYGRVKNTLRSFDGGKMASTIMNIDLEEMSYCLACAVLKHIQFGERQYQLERLNFSKNQNFNGMAQQIESNVNQQNNESLIDNSLSFFESVQLQDKQDQVQDQNLNHNQNLNNNQNITEFDYMERHFNKSVQQTHQNKNGKFKDNADQLEESDEYIDQAYFQDEGMLANDSLELNDDGIGGSASSQLDVISEKSSIREGNSTLQQQEMNQEGKQDILKDILRESVQANNLISLASQISDLRQSRVEHIIHDNNSNQKQQNSQNTIDFHLHFSDDNSNLNLNTYVNVATTVQSIQSFAKNILLTARMEKESVVICLVYLERLICMSGGQGVYIREATWRKVLFIALILASKIWDDESFENDNFASAFTGFKYTTKDINAMEAVFLRIIDYSLFMHPQEYAKYYFVMRQFATRHQRGFPLQLLDLHTILNLQNNCKMAQIRLNKKHQHSKNKSF